MSPDLISWSQVSRRFGMDPPTIALHPTSIDLAAGQYVAITGPSGSGKSTMLNVLGLLDSPSTGVYRLQGLDIVSLPDRARTALRMEFFGFVFQAFHLVHHLTVLENVELGMLYTRRSRAERRSRAATLLESVDMVHRSHAFPPTLSGGEQQRVAIVRALGPSPRVLICDEPTGNLDSANSRKILDIFAGLHGIGTTIVIATHDPIVAERATRRIGMCDGRVSSDEVNTAS